MILNSRLGTQFRLFFSRVAGTALLTAVLIVCYASPADAQWTTNGNNINNTNSGNVGIGTASPTAKLHVFGSGNIQSILQSTTAAAELGLVSTAAGSGSWSIGTGWATSGAIRNLYFYDNVAAATRLLINSSGNVGIGTTGPGKKLVVQSDTANDHVSIVRPTTNAATLNIGIDNTGPFLESTTANRPISFYTHNGTSVAERVRIDKDGNLGIGTTTPAGRLEVKSAASTHNSLYLNTTTAGYADSLVFQEAGTAKASIQHNPSVLSGAILFNTNGIASPANTRMVINGAGNVGIGTTSPNANYKLDINGNTNVTGNINLTGTINAKYQDVAEWVPSVHALPAGTVVTLDPTKSNHVEASSKAYDTRVAGVISAQPGIALGEQGENKLLVATTGRVRIKVDASHGPIQVGDLLVTSNIPGLAMKSQPFNVGGVEIHRPGTLIGKALEPLAKGRGEILVLLSLQ